MIPIAPDHLAHIADGDLLPLQVPDVLPAGDLFENQQPHLIARIQKIGRLRIMRSADDVAMQLMLQNPCIAPLDARRHGPANVRKRLMPVQPTQLHMPAVQPESRRRELRLPEPDPRAVLISRLRPYNHVI